MLYSLIPIIYHLFKEAQEPLCLGLALLVAPLFFIGLLIEEIQDGIIFFLLFLGEGVGRLAMAEVEVSDIQWGKKVFSQPPIVQVLPLKKMREACNFHNRYTSTTRDKIRKENPENHIEGFLKNLFANYGGK